jgi:hypothetical protein
MPCRRRLVSAHPRQLQWCPLPIGVVQRCLERWIQVRELPSGARAHTRAHTHTHTHPRTHARAHAHAHAHAHTQPRTLAHTHSRTHAHTHTHALLHTRTHAHTHAHTHTHTHTVSRCAYDICTYLHSLFQFLYHFPTASLNSITARPQVSQRDGGCEPSMHRRPRQCIQPGRACR